MAVIRAWPIITFLGLLIFKRSLLGYLPPFYLDVVSDLLSLALMFCLSFQRKTRVAQCIQNILAALFLLYTWADTCIILAIDNRLTLDNVIGNYKYLNVIPYFISTKLVVYTLLTLLVLLILRKKKFTLKYSATSTNFINYEIIFVLTLCYLTLHNEGFGLGNVINVADHSFTANSVTPATIEQINFKYPLEVERIEAFFSGEHWRQPPTQPGPNIIIVLSESLSGVDSKYANGLFDRLPNIDKIQQDGLALSHAVSNGKITVHGLGSFILAAQPLKTGGYSSIQDQFPADKFAGNNVIAYAKKAGYKTIAISAGQPRDWEGLSLWFKEVGFDEVYDRDSPEFKDAPRFTWEAPDDEAMYALAEKLIPEQKTPYLLLIETVSLHQPYILPDPKYQISPSPLLNQIHYVDVTTATFYDNLKTMGFLNDGVFVLFGDHRRFEPLEKAELDHGGYARWAEHIVFTITGKDIAPHVLSSTPFSLIDLNSLLHMVINGEKINENSMLQANLGIRLGIGLPFTITLSDDEHGAYLVRSSQYPPMLVSIFGAVPFEEIPNGIYQSATNYLIINDQKTTQLLNQ